MMPKSQNCKSSTWLLSDNDCIIIILHEYGLNLTFKKRLYWKIDFLLSNSGLVVDLWGLSRNVSSINDKLPWILHGFGLPFIFIRYTYSPHKFVKMRGNVFLLIAAED